MLQDSGYDCRTCDRPNARCHMSSQKKCYCKKGYVRDSYGNCVSVNSCPKKRKFFQTPQDLAKTLQKR